VTEPSKHRARKAALSPLVFVELFIAWVLFTSLDGRGNPWPVVGAAALGGAALLLGRWLPRVARVPVATGLAVGAVVAVVFGSGALSSPLAGPLGYANANAALLVQAAALFGLVAVDGERRLRVLGWGGGLVCLALCALIGAVAAVVGCVLVLVATVPFRRASRRAVVSSCLAVMVAGSALAFVVGAVSAPRVVQDAVTERRVALWTDGVDALSDDPLLGVGSRRFAKVSPTAAHDPDTREAHAELLQRGVENGVPGLLLELAAVAATVGLLLRRGDQVSAVALAGLAALWANAGVDWILAYPMVLGFGAFAAGLGISRHGR
jgi:O-antigen ligase